MYLAIIFLMSKVSMPPSEEMDFEEFDNDWQEQDGDQLEQERIVHNIKVAKS